MSITYWILIILAILLLIGILVFILFKCLSKKKSSARSAQSAFIPEAIINEMLPKSVKSSEIPKYQRSIKYKIVEPLPLSPQAESSYLEPRSIISKTNSSKSPIYEHVDGSQSSTMGSVYKGSDKRNSTDSTWNERKLYENVPWVREKLYENVPQDMLYVDIAARNRSSSSPTKSTSCETCAPTWSDDEAWYTRI